MNRFSEPPEEPYQRSAPIILSPTSPKPVHFPQPTNIPVLNMQTDVGFNQTEAHMSDPALRDTDLRPNAWRDPAAAPDSDMVDNANPANPPSNDVSYENNAQLQPGPALSADLGVPLPSSDPSMPSAVLATGSDAPNADSLPPAHELIPGHSQPSPTPGTGSAQSLLDSLQSSIAPPNPADSATATLGLTVPSALSPPNVQSQTTIDAGSALLSPTDQSVPPSGLPPRPPPQEQPLINPNYVHTPHIQAYHPHAANMALQPRNKIDSNGKPTNPHSDLVSSLQPTTAYQGSSSSEQISPANQRHINAVAKPAGSVTSNKRTSGDAPGPDDKPWSADIQRKYDHFLEEERRYVSEARWDQFPPNTRLFVGNLASEAVTKRDIFHVFHPYGQIAQVSIKQGYAFVQFLEAPDLAEALKYEHKRKIRDKEINLEVSKAQKKGPDKTRRSRSPDYGRGHSGRDTRNDRGRYRSPSPRGRFRDRYDSRDRPRSRESGYGRGSDSAGRGRGSDGGYGVSTGGGSRYSSPRREEREPLHRPATEVPDVHMVAVGELDTNFVQSVYGTFMARGLKVELVIQPYMADEGVLERRQALEGVAALVKLHRAGNNVVSVTNFKRGATGKVDIDRYNVIDPNVAVDLVSKELQRAPRPHGANVRSEQGNPPPVGSYGGHTGYGANPPAAGMYGGYPAYGANMKPEPVSPQSAGPYGGYQGHGMNVTQGQGSPTSAGPYGGHPGYGAPQPAQPLQNPYQQQQQSLPTLPSGWPPGYGAPAPQASLPPVPAGYQAAYAPRPNPSVNPNAPPTSHAAYGTPTQAYGTGAYGAQAAYGAPQGGYTPAAGMQQRQQQQQAQGTTGYPAQSAAPANMQEILARLGNPR